MANFLDLKKSASYLLDDLQFGYFTQEQVGLWLNNAQHTLQWRLIQAGQNYYLRRFQTTLVVNQQDYVLPLDFKKLHRLEVIISGTAPNESVQPLLPITTNQQDFIPNGNGTPQWYSFKRNRLVLYPFPNAPLTLRMQYSYQTTDMVLDTDLPDIISDYAQYLPVVAVEDGFIKDGRPSDLLNKRMMELEKKIDSDAQERNQDTPRNIVYTGENDQGGFYW